MLIKHRGMVIKNFPPLIEDTYRLISIIKSNSTTQIIK